MPRLRAERPRDAQWSFDAGVQCASTVPTRSGNGIMQRLERDGREENTPLAKRSRMPTDDVSEFRAPAVNSAASVLPWTLILAMPFCQTPLSGPSGEAKARCRSGGMPTRVGRPGDMEQPRLRRIVRERLVENSG